MLAFLCVFASRMRVSTQMGNKQLGCPSLTASDAVGRSPNTTLRCCSVLTSLFVLWLAGCGVAVAQLPIVLGQTVTQITTGGAHTCALTTSGGAQCWGWNASVPIGPASFGLAAISAGEEHTCGLTTAGEVVCWGYNGEGQTSVPTALASGGAAAISAGQFHTCALTSAGAVQCWGWNGSGQSSVPATLASGGAVAISAGEEHTCALTTAGGVQCWGWNGHGQTSVPAALISGGVAAISAGAYFTCALTMAGGVQCWGDNYYGQTGVPAALASGGVAAISAGSYHACALMTAGGVQCWGDNIDGESSVPAGLVSGGAAAISAGGLHTCALTTAGRMQCWGDNTNRQVSVPIELASGGEAAISAGGYHTCVLMKAGWVQCWGANGAGQTSVPNVQLIVAAAISAGANHTCALTTAGGVQCWGDDSSGQTNVPTALASEGAAAISAGGGHTCALTTGGGVECWGGNGSGQSSVPTALVGGGAAAISLGLLHTCALTTAGGVQCWGDNGYGQTGVPSALASGGVAAISAGSLHTCALTIAGSVQCWGWNNSGQTSVPTVLTSGGVVAISAGSDHTCAVTTAGGVQCWGSNGLGEASVPTALASGGVKAVAAGWQHTCALTMSADVVCWGDNTFGESGRAGQTITFSTSANLAVGGTLTLSASASSGGTVTFDTWTPDTCTVSGTTLKATAIALCGVRASQAGSNDAAPAPQQLRLIQVVPSATSGYVPLSPKRLLDTRAGSSTIDGQFVGIGAAASGGVIELTVAGRGGVPAIDVVAAVLNVTATNPTASGYITAWPSGSPQPFASNLNFTPGKTIPNLVIAKLGANGKVSLYNSAGTTDLIADVAGYFGAGTDLNALSPARLLDTRAGFSTIDGQFQGTGALPADGTLNLMIGGRDGIPSSGVGAAILNVTAVHPTATGYLTLWPSDAAQPWASNLNFAPAEDIPNLVISKVSALGEVSIYNSVGTTDVIADVAGWFPSGSQLTPLVPARIMDTRPGSSTIDGQAQGAGALLKTSTVNLTVLNRGGVPASGVSAVVLNVTVTDPTAPGYLTIWPAGRFRPLASNLNFIANQTIANLVIAKVGTNGQVELYNGSAGTSQVVVDVVGWFAEQ